MGTLKTLFSKSSTWAALSLIILLLACYGNSFQGAWQYDDYINIVNNPKIRMAAFSWAKIGEALTAGPNSQIVGRPLAYLSFALNYLWGGENPLGYHLINLIIHCLTSLFLFFFVRDTLRLPIFASRYTDEATLIAWLSALFWACHPLQVTAVTYIVQRMTAMAGLFYIAALYAYLVGRTAAKTQQRIWAFGLGGLSAVCAMLSKENAVLLPYAVLLYELLFFRALDRRTVFKALFWAVGVTGGVLLLSFLYANPLKLFEPYTNRPFTMVERVLTQPRVLFIYLALLAVPMVSRMSIIHDVVFSKSIWVPWTTWAAIIGLIFIVTGLCLLARRHRLFAFCGLFFFLNHALEASILNLDLVYEHRNYVPSMLLFVPLAVGVVRCMAIFYYRPAMRMVIAGCVGLILVTRAQTTFEYNRVFASELELWRHATLVYPNCSLAFNNLGKAYWLAGDFEKSYQYISRAAELDNFGNFLQKGVVYYNLGIYAVNIPKDLETALSRFEMASDYMNFPEIWFHMANIQMQRGVFDRAGEILAEGLEEWPNDRFLNGLTMINTLKRGDYAGAIRLARLALEKKRGEERIAMMVIAQSHWLQNERDAALQEWQRLLKKDPNNAAALLALTELHVLSGQSQVAKDYLRRVLELKGIDYLKNQVAFETKSENIMPYVPNVKLINQLLKEMSK
mgnify:CR=1 FL=1